jgi:acetoacetyl-CoA synthetase
MAVEQELPDTLAGGRIVLLVVLKPAAALTSDLVLRLRRQIARRIAPAYVPGVIVDVPELPTTHSGKRSETAARDAINGRPIRNREALRNAGCLEAIGDHPGLRKGSTAVPAAKSGQSTVDVLKAIWASTFGVDTIGADEDFFALGGDSLLAIQICMQIEQAFGYDLPIAALFHANTVASLAAALEGGIVWQGDSPLVPLKEGAGRPVFLLHSIAGNVFEWHALLDRLDCGRPIVAVQARGLNPTETPADSVEAMAADYVDLIRAHQPDGPYTLLGYSFGGLLAYEIAVRLSRMGETLDFLGLIDTDVQAGALPMLEWLRFRLARLLHFCQRTAGLRVEGTLRRGWAKVRHQPHEPEAFRADIGVEANLPPPLRRVRVACVQAFAVYDPPSYSGEVIFFRCPERSPLYCDPLIVWRRVAASVCVIDVLGSHGTLMMEPNVDPLAAEFANCLKRCASSSAGIL